VYSLTRRSQPQNIVTLVKNHEQQPQGLRTANEDKTETYRLDRRYYVIPHAEFRSPYPDQRVMTPQSQNDRREATESHQIGEDTVANSRCPRR